MNVCREIIRTSRFQKDLSKLSKKGVDVDKIEETVTLLSQHRISEVKDNHKLKGKQKDYWECHVLGTILGNDLVVVY